MASEGLEGRDDANDDEARVPDPARGGGGARRWPVRVLGRVEHRRGGRHRVPLRLVGEVRVERVRRDLLRHVDREVPLQEAGEGIQRLVAARAGCGMEAFARSACISGIFR